MCTVVSLPIPWRVVTAAHLVTEHTGDRYSRGPHCEVAHGDKVISISPAILPTLVFLTRGNGEQGIEGSLFDSQHAAVVELAECADFIFTEVTHSVPALHHLARYRLLAL